MSLALLKSEVLSVLADAYDETAWSDATLEEALRQALLFFHTHAELRETTFTLLDSGYEHDLSDLGAHDLLAIGWPWGDGYRLEAVLRPWRLVGDLVVRMDSLSLQAGEQIRVQFLPRHTIQHLDGAMATTFREIEQRRFVLAAAHFCFLSRARYFSHFGSDEQRLRLPSLAEAAQGLMDQFLAFNPSRLSSSDFLTWGALGL